MHWSVVVAVLPVIFLGELPDKTMFASLLMASRGHPLAVWAGVAAAFLVHVIIATSIGVGLFHLLPHRAVEAFVTALFLAGAVMAFVESREEDEAELVEREARAHHRVAAASFAVIFVAEWGDLTQILTANMAAHYRAPFSVALGAIAGLWAVAALAVVSGQRLMRRVSVRKVRLTTAVVLLALAAWSGYSAVRG